MTDTPNLKRKDFTPCLRCKKGVLHTQNIAFYKITLSQYIADPKNIQREHGLELMLGGNPLLTEALSPNLDLAHHLTTTTGLLCIDCAMEIPLAAILDE